jgi:hypothetical protein
MTKNSRQKPNHAEPPKQVLEAVGLKEQLMVEDRELIAARNGLSAEEQIKLEDLENQEWRESLEYVLRSAGRDRVAQLMEMLENYAYHLGWSSTTRSTRLT